MIKFFSLILFLAFLISCETESSIVGNWIEVNYKMETLQFFDDGKMEIKKKGDQGQTPINFKYEIIESKDNWMLMDISVYNSSTFIKKAKHKVVFKDKNTIIVENVDFPETKSNTYFRD
jgi:hypothetical protein